MCGIGVILRIHEPDSPEAVRLREALDGAWECRLQRTGHDEQDAGTRPYASAPWSIPESDLDLLDDAIRHRGPDGRGRFRDGAVKEDGTVVEVALVHRRLSIIDHDGGAQPMVCESGPDRDDDLTAVVFNGCIYNHRDLRAELQRDGHRFESDHSDTEAILRGHRAWGAGLRQRLDGMYAIAIWDRSSATLTLERDRAGEKPLYLVHFADDSVVACSSAAGLLRLERPDRIGSRTLVNGWMRDGFGVSPSCVGSVDEVPPSFRVGFPTPVGGRSVFSTGAVIEPPASAARTARVTPDRIESLIDEAVASRLEADVPIGCFLSGGVDSSLVARAAHRALGRLQTFSVRMPEAAYDESPIAERVASQLGTDHHTLDCRADPAADLVRLIEQLGLPFGDSSLLPTAWCSAAVREVAPVALAGDGADELFGGYARHIAALRLQRFGPAKSLAGLIPSSLLNESDPKSRSARLARLARARGAYPEMLAIFTRPDLQRVLTPEGRMLLDTDPRHAVRDPLMRDLHEYLPGDILRKTDSASMAVALEVRSPFLARDVVDAATGATLESLLPKLERKSILRTLARTHFGPEVADRPKMGFAIPIGSWFRSDDGGMRQLLHDHLRSSEPFGSASLGLDGLVDREAVARLLEEHDDAGRPSGRPWRGRDHSQRLYVLLVLSIWSRWLDSLPERVADQA